MDKLEERMGEVEKKQIQMGANVDHIKERLDNGISKTITKIFDLLNSFTKTQGEIATKVEDHVFWVGILKKGVIFLAVSGVVGGSVALAFALLKKGL